MKKTSRGPSFLSGLLAVFSRKPVESRMKIGPKANAPVRVNHDRQQFSGVNFPYRAAVIVVGDCACDAVQRFAGTRFLVSDVPHVPLPGCTERKCGCTYERYLDRRNQNGDRRAEYSALTLNPATASGAAIQNV